MNPCLGQISVVILCGGLGKRLRPALNDKPKALAKINNKPFLDILLDNLLPFGFKQFIFCMGYQKEKIKRHLLGNEKYAGYNLIFSEESMPLGTGGALKLAEPLVEGNTFLVLNGDSFCKVDLLSFLEFHRNKNALISILLTSYKNADDAGFVSINEDNKIDSFDEKQNRHSSGYINAGMYFLEKRVFSYMPSTAMFSLEYDFFPKMVDKEMYGYVVKEELIDIGTPERYKQAQLNRIFSS